MPEPVLRVRDLKKAYQDVVAVNGLDLEVHPGECFGLLGPNGAGKTTTIEICEGLTARDSGEAEEILRELAFHVMVERGLADSDARRIVSNEETARRIRSWRS
jgi:ABC-type branched-subunit amino acid transport system ATPase component